MPRVCTWRRRHAMLCVAPRARGGAVSPPCRPRVPALPSPRPGPRRALGTQPATGGSAAPGAAEPRHGRSPRHVVAHSPLDVNCTSRTPRARGRPARCTPMLLGRGAGRRLGNLAAGRRRPACGLLPSSGPLCVPVRNQNRRLATRRASTSESTLLCAAGPAARRADHPSDAHPQGVAAAHFRSGTSTSLPSLTRVGMSGWNVLGLCSAVGSQARYHRVQACKAGGRWPAPITARALHPRASHRYAPQPPRHRSPSLRPPPTESSGFDHCGMSVRWRCMGCGGGRTT